MRSWLRETGLPDALTSGSDHCSMSGFGRQRLRCEINGHAYLELYVARHGRGFQ